MSNLQSVGGATRRGLALLEVIISIAILGITASVATLMIRRSPPPAPTSPAAIISDTLEHVLTNGSPVTLQLTVNGRLALAVVNPDGSVVADSILAVDRLTGKAAR